MTTRQKLPIHILGTGAIGLFCAMRLKKQGYDVTLLSRPEKKPLSKQKVTIKYGHQFQQQEFTVTPTRLQQKNIHMLLVCVKAYQLEAALTAVIHAITRRTVIVLMQNGMAVEKKPLKKHPSLIKNQFFHAVNSHGVLKTAPFSIIYSGSGSCLIGSLQKLDSRTDIMLKNHCLRLVDSHFFDNWCEDIYLKLWQKLIINAAINPLSALLQCRNGDLLQYNHWSIVEKIVEECCEIAYDKHLFLDYQQMLAQVKQVCLATKSNFSSMAQDVLFKRTTEIDYINGYLLSQSQKCFTDCHYNRTLLNMVKYQQQ